MESNKRLYCLMGESGSGKSALANFLKDYDGYKIINSYTTRPKRNEDENGHTFISDEEYENIKNNETIVAYSLFNGYHYFCTLNQVKENDIYIVDPDGIEVLKSNLPDDIEIKVIYIYANIFRRIQRMFQRGDTIISIIKRIINDHRKFRNKKYDFSIDNNKLLLNSYTELSFVLNAYRLWTELKGSRGEFNNEQKVYNVIQSW